jgi:hypothetical protein
MAQPFFDKHTNDKNDKQSATSALVRTSCLSFLSFSVISRFVLLNEVNDANKPRVGQE